MGQPGKRRPSVCGQEFGRKPPQKLSKFYGDKPIHSPDGPIIGKVYFPTGQSILSSDDFGMLNQLVMWCTFERLKGNLFSLKFLGHADKQQYASERVFFSEANLELSRRRAKTVSNYVKNALDFGGFDFVEHEALGLGESHKHTDLAENRRVDIIARIEPLPPPPLASADPSVKPVQILNITYTFVLRSSERGSGRGYLTKHDTVIVEKTARVEKDQTVRDWKSIKTWHHQGWHNIMWVVQVTRYEIKWRVPTTSDRVMQGIDIGTSIGGKGPTEGDGLPNFGPPTHMYYGWEDVKKKDPDFYNEFKRYKL